MDLIFSAGHTCDRAVQGDVDGSAHSTYKFSLLQNPPSSTQYHTQLCSAVYTRQDKIMTKAYTLECVLR